MFSILSFFMLRSKSLIIPNDQKNCPFDRAVNGHEERKPFLRVASTPPEAASGGVIS